MGEWIWKTRKINTNEYITGIANVGTPLAKEVTVFVHHGGTVRVNYCPVCGKRGDDTFFNFCPNCGADMRKKGEE